MRLTLVSPFDPSPADAALGAERVGGVERVFAQVSRRLAARGHDVTLVCSSSGPATTSSEDGVRVVRAPRRATVLQAPVANLARSIQADTDVVHVAATYPFTTPSVLRKARDLRVPSILDFHFEPAPSSAIGRLAAAAYRHVGPRHYNLAALALVRSFAYGRSAPSLGRVPTERWRIVPNGVDPARFNAEGPAQEGDYLLYVGRLVHYKGLHVLIDALARLADPPPLVVVGDGPELRRLSRQARVLGVDARFLGRLPDDLLPPLYRGARCTVLPSVTGQESFGISLIESMACGTPVVASRLAGVAEVARLGGLLAEPGDAAGLARRLDAALEPKALPRGKPLAARVHAAFSWDAVTDRLESVYREVTGSPSGSAPAAA